MSTTPNEITTPCTADAAPLAAYWQGVTATLRTIIETLPRMGSTALMNESASLRKELGRLVSILEHGATKPPLCPQCGKPLLFVWASDFEGWACMSTMLCVFRLPSRQHSVGLPTSPAASPQ